MQKNAGHRPDVLRTKAASRRKENESLCVELLAMSESATAQRC